MATALLEKIEDFTACSICFEQLKDPIGLPCLHGFCFKCLQDWHGASSSPDKREVVCPACKKSTPLPEDGIRGFPAHFLMNSLMDTVNQEKLVQKSQSATPCEICDVPADSHCLDCTQYLCAKCCKQHSAHKAQKQHKIVSADAISRKLSSTGRNCKPLPTRRGSGQWTQTVHVSTAHFLFLRDIAILPDGGLVIASLKSGARIYSLKQNGKVSYCTREFFLRCTPDSLFAITVTPDGRILTYEIGNAEILCYNRQGKQLNLIKTKHPLDALAVDKNGRIVAGMYNTVQRINIISIYYSDGSQISWFRTSKPVHYISTTSQDTLVVTLEVDFGTRILQVMTYQGRIITEIDKGNKWNPGYTCCNSRDEIFVISDIRRGCIFWYTHEGQYLGRVTSDVKCPKGLTVSSHDELIVAEENGTVKYFSEPQKK